MAFVVGFGICCWFGNFLAAEFIVVHYVHFLKLYITLFVQNRYREMPVLQSLISIYNAVMIMNTDTHTNTLTQVAAKMHSLCDGSMGFSVAHKAGRCGCSLELCPIIDHYNARRSAIDDR